MAENEKKEEIPKTDNRMWFIRLLESPEERAYCTECEIASEARITGQLTYSNDLILRLLTTEANRDGLYKYTLSFCAPATYKLPRYEPSKEGYYFGDGGEAGEIISLASLLLRCRFFPISNTFRGITGPAMTKNEEDFSYVHPQKNSDILLFSEPARSFMPLSDLFDKVKKLPEDLHHRFANAIRLYALALREIGVNDQQAYVHLVSSIEILSKYQPLSAIQDPLQSKIEEIKAVLKDTSPETKSEFGNLLEQRKTRMKFCIFVQEYSEGMLPAIPVSGKLEAKIYKETLPNALDRIYSARSKFLHEGASMYMSIPGMTGTDCDYDASRGQTIDNREFDPESKLPNISFFENLVRGCLLNYLDKNITA